MTPYLVCKRGVKESNPGELGWSQSCFRNIYTTNLRLDRDHQPPEVVTSLADQPGPVNSVGRGWGGDQIDHTALIFYIIIDP